MTNYFTSDWHLGHESIINWERTQFKTIQEHDKTILGFVRRLAKKIKYGDIVYMLGDYGDTDKLWYIDELSHAGAYTIFIAGNHDKLADIDKFEAYFDEVHWHPIYLSERLIVSHYPQAVYNSQLSIHGHIHNGYIGLSNYINCNIHYCNYQAISDKTINNRFSKIDKFDTTFLYEPWIEEQFSTIKREDLVLLQNNKIDVSASRALKKFLGQK